MADAELKTVAKVVELDEGRLLTRHLEGSPDAFAELVARYRAPVYAYLCRCDVEPEARDDLFQEIFIKVHRAAASYRPERPLHPWLFTIVANTVRSHLRKRRVRRLVHGSRPAEDPPDPSPDGGRAAAARQTVGRLEAEIARLPIVKRQVVLLACVEKLPLKEVAAALGLKVNTVKTHLRRARLTLAEALARHSEPEVKP
jgi:RNA polymerase sigma-70 factor (ECF subfamily)